MKNKKTRKAAPKRFPIWGWIAIAAVVVIAAGVAFAALQGSAATAAPLPAEVSVDQAARLRDQGAFILDVREPSEWTQFHIPGATLIPLGELPNRLNEVPKDRPVVVVCRTGHRSAQGRDILKDAGLTN